LIDSRDTTFPSCSALLWRYTMNGINHRFSYTQLSQSRFQN
jgi:hypothetical protein